MIRLAVVLAGALVCAAVPGATDAAAQEVREVHVTGANELGTDAVLSAAAVRAGDTLPETPDALKRIADRVVHRYTDEGYSFAKVQPSFDAATGALTLAVDEGVIDRVEFTGVDDRLKRIFEEQYALQKGDVFTRKRARQALEVLLRQTRGAIRPGSIFERGAAFYDSREVSGKYEGTQRTFDLVDRNGERTLLVGLREAAGRFKLAPDLGDREDWFTSVDGFVPSMGFGAAVFDHKAFNHAYVAGHLSYKTASEEFGYTIGFERPFFAARKLYVGAEAYDLTASDDQWQISSLEASLAALGPRRSFRDYYHRRGFQIDAAYRPLQQVELFGAWRAERQEPLAVESDFSFWNSDEAFKPNRPVVDGHLGSLIVGASANARAFDRESLDGTYRRHQLSTFYGDRLDGTGRNDFSFNWRADWTTEISRPGAFDSDFDFTRTILYGRVRKRLSPHQEFSARGARGWTDGLPPPQRLFALGGIGSIHGYDYKAETGTSMTLYNVEYALGWMNGLHVIGFYDAGQVASRPWMRGIGWGIGISEFRVDFGYRTDSIPDSLQVLVRFGRTF